MSLLVSQPGGLNSRAKSNQDSVNGLMAIQETNLEHDDKGREDDNSGRKPSQKSVVEAPNSGLLSPQRQQRLIKLEDT